MDERGHSPSSRLLPNPEHAGDRDRGRVFQTLDGSGSSCDQPTGAMGRPGNVNNNDFTSGGFESGERRGHEFALDYDDMLTVSEGSKGSSPDRS